MSTSHDDQYTKRVCNVPMSGDNDTTTKDSGYAEDEDWNNDKSNPLNWPAGRKALVVIMGSATAFTTSAATSIISPAQESLAKEFGVGRTVSLLPLSLYVFALAFGPVIGGPLSEVVGRMPIYYVGYPLGALFTLGAGFSHNFGALCFLRFMAGLCWAPTLAVAAGSVSETFQPRSRGPVIALFVLMPFLGPGFGPILGSFAVSRYDWRWTQWILLIFALFCFLLIAFTKETFRGAIKPQSNEKKCHETVLNPTLAEKLWNHAVIGLGRPVHMLCMEPIVSLTCAYISMNFGILFSFFAVVPYTFGPIFGFDTEQSGLVFSSVIVGCLLGLITVFACEVLLYRRLAARYWPQNPSPEHRLYPAMLGSFGLPIGLFWYAWTARPDYTWVNAAIAIIPYAWGNICIFVPCVQYITDTYHPSVVASVISANSLTRYAFAGAFPLFVIQMYEKLGIDWGTSLLGFITIGLLPIPWLLYKFGPTIRAKSKYKTFSFGS